MFKHDFFFFKVFLLLSTLHTVTFPTSVGTFRLLHFGIPIMLFTVVKNQRYWFRGIKRYNNIFCFLFFFLLYGGISYFNSVFPSGTKRIFFSTVLNYVIFFYFISFLETYKRKIPQVMSFVMRLVKLMCYMVILQWIGAMVHLVPIGQAGEGLLSVGRPALFFNDPNWCGYFILFLHMMVETFNDMRHIKTDKRYRLLVFVSFMLIQSRIMLLCWLFHYIFGAMRYRNKWLIVPFILAALFFFIDTSILKQILPERFLYDIVSLDENPRLMDIENITGEITAYHREDFGMGWGSLAKIADDFPWRNYDITINVFPAQIYFDFGYTGFAIFLILMTWAFVTIKGDSFKLLFSFLILNCCFHMPGYFCFSWVLYAIFVFLYEDKHSILSL